MCPATGGVNSNVNIVKLQHLTIAAPVYNTVILSSFPCLYTTIVCSDASHLLTTQAPLYTLILQYLTSHPCLYSTTVNSNAPTHQSISPTLHHHCMFWCTHIITHLLTASPLWVWYTHTPAHCSPLLLFVLNLQNIKVKYQYTKHFHISLVF